MVTLFLERGANPCRIDAKGCTPYKVFTRQILTDENAEKVSHFSWQARKKLGTTSEGSSLPPHIKVKNEKLKSP